MSETRRFLLAGFLLAVLFFIAPFYLQFVGVEGPPLDASVDDAIVNQSSSQEIILDPEEDQKQNTNVDNPNFSLSNSQLKSFTIRTDVANIVTSNRSGGSLVSFSLNSNISDGYKYLGGYDDEGVYHDSLNVSLSKKSAAA